MKRKVATIGTNASRTASRLALALAGITTAPAVLAQVQLSTITVTGTEMVANAKLPLDTQTQTGSRLGLSARETPATINIVDRDTIEERGARDTIEAVSGAPGITEHGSPGSGGVLSYRGFTSSQITQMYNGIDVGYIIANVPVDSWTLDRVEVLGGASSFLYGSGAVGGAVNYVSKLATNQPLSRESLVGVGSFGQYQAAYGVNGRVGDPQSGHFLRADISVKGTDGYVDRTDGRDLVFAGSWLWNIGSRFSHTLAWEYQTKDLQPYWGTPLLNPTVNSRFDPAIRFKNFNAADGTYEQDVQWFRSILDYRISDATQIKNTLYHYDADREYRNVEQYRYNAANTLVTRNSAFPTAHGQSLIGNKLELLHKSTLFGVPSTTSVGLDISRNKQTRYPSATISPVSTVNPLDFTVSNFFDTAGVLPATNPDRTNKVFTQALYAENLTRFARDWGLISGLRVERIKLTVDNFRAVNAANPRYFEQSYSPLTGRLGVMHDISPSANAYLTYSTAADPPAGILSTTNYGPIQGWDLTTGNQIELGSKFDFLEGRGNATLAAYKIVRKNLSTPDPNNPNVSLPIGEQSSRGIEAQAGLRLNRHWRVQGNVALVAARYDRFVQNVGGTAVSLAGNRPTNIPARVANVWLTWNADASWSTTLEARYVGDRYADTANTQRFDAYTLWGASASYKIDRHNTLTLRGRNLDDTIYFASGSTQVRIGEPRSFELTLQSKF